MQTRWLTGVCLLVGAFVAAPSASAEPFSVDALRGATVITVAGGGDELPRDGAVATRVRLEQAPSPVRTALLDDGTPVFTAYVGGFTRLFVVGSDGRLRALPVLPLHGALGNHDARRAGADPVLDVAAGPEGELLATGQCSGFIYRLAPGATAWTPVVNLRDWRSLVPGEASFWMGGRLDDGSILIGGGPYGAWRWLAPGGPLVIAPVPGVTWPAPLYRLTALRGGGFAYINSRNWSVGRVSPDGMSTTIIRRAAGEPLGIAPTPDGQVLLAYGDRLLVVGPTGFARAVTARSGVGGEQAARLGLLRCTP